MLDDNWRKLGRTLMSLIFVATTCPMVMLQGCDGGLELEGPREVKPPRKPSPPTGPVQPGKLASEASSAASPAPGISNPSGSLVGGVDNKPESQEPGKQQTVIPAQPLPPQVFGTPSPAASPMLGVKRLETNSNSAVLYLPAADPATSLGLSTKFQFEGVAILSDESKGAVRWLDRSNGQLDVKNTGLVSTTATTSLGIHFVRVTSMNDSNFFKDLPIEVRSNGQLDVTIK